MTLNNAVQIRMRNSNMNVLPWRQVLKLQRIIGCRNVNVERDAAKLRIDFDDNKKLDVLLSTKLQVTTILLTRHFILSGKSAGSIAPAVPKQNKNYMKVIGCMDGDK